MGEDQDVQALCAYRRTDPLNNEGMDPRYNDAVTICASSVRGHHRFAHLAIIGPSQDVRGAN